MCGLKVSLSLAYMRSLLDPISTPISDHGVPGWGVSSDGREVLIVRHRRLLEIGVTNNMIMGSGYNME